MVAMVNDEIFYTFNSKCQKPSKSHASFFILKVSIMILVYLRPKVTLHCYYIYLFWVLVSGILNVIN